MPEIKVKSKGTIKKLDKNVVQVQKFKSNLVTIKEKINEFTSNEENNSAENYASNKIQNDINYTSRKGISKTNEIGRKSLKETYDNIKNGKQKINTIKSRIKNKDINELKNVINKTNKTIKSGTKQSIKTAKNTKVLTKKGIKTTEQVAKNSKIVAKESIKTTQRAIRISKKIIQATVKATKVAIKATTQVIKAIAQAIKGIVAAIVAGGWVAVIIIIVIVLISGLIAAIFYGTGDDEYEFSQIPSSQILLVAKAQLGNEGGDKFWKWYGFTH